MSKQLRDTRKIELVETHNLALSFDRLRENYGRGTRWKRALYHALAMSDIASSAELLKIREALELP